MHCRVVPPHLAGAWGALYECQPLPRQQPRSHGLDLVVADEALLAPRAQEVQEDGALPRRPEGVVGHARLVPGTLLGRQRCADGAGGPVLGVQDEGTVRLGAHLVQRHPGAGQSGERTHAQHAHHLGGGTGSAVSGSKGVLRATAVADGWDELEPSAPLPDGSQEGPRGI